MAGVLSPPHLQLLCVLFVCVLDTTGGLASQTAQFSSYEVSVPKRIGRHRREQDGSVSNKVSYVIPAQGKEHVVILERNEFLLPDDFTVYSYAPTPRTDH
ncbi:hypothetical protein Q7C36_012237 [Tachysurus vachellii]|uniref:Peptidase M12B propeptide domain-containing protein n=1 Tax=Tachysurus vachellii TaxID=175792 RepID=A0AA88MM26_TACVA|nr:hypothetical protein Q7C36_012237 [Tachysurus vachellii]